MSFSIDRRDTEPNEIHRAYNDEYRTALHALTETERAQHCRHNPGRSGQCRYCGEQIVDREDT